MSDLDKSYALGTFPTLELLAHQPNAVSKIYLSSKVTPEIASRFSQFSQLVETNDRQISRLARSENTYVIGEFYKYTTSLDASASHLVLDQVSDMGNLGTIIRTMVGFNCFNLGLISPAADIFHPKVVRASMGAIFQINFQYFDSFSDYSQAFPRNYYPFISDARQPMQTALFHEPFTLIFGNESAGLPEFYNSTGTPIRIEQNENIDSLNLSIAAALGLYHAYISHQ